ncbi:hypothetical protein TGVEG_442330 [Toxoplasma gondii VEG]|uniref:Uncharacterized protein n=1 Tax=Toxoplasma gondii (strain ATCC 50861 / VEG) TaxID=432359 RepID=V5AWF1_TOXGV|nr:hypothetical protein TGVEG_442330 [Toxoplasma gondii VEG]
MWEGHPERLDAGPYIPDCLGMQRSIPNPSGIPTEDENAVAAVRRVLRIWYVGGGATAAPSSLLIAQPEDAAPVLSMVRQFLLVGGAGLREKDGTWRCRKATSQ